MSYIKVRSPNSKNESKEFKFPIDTGAGVSLSKAIETVGSCMLSLEIDGSEIFCKFHRLNQATNVPYDGLIGKDILQQNFAIIDYETQILKFRSISNPMTLFTDKDDYDDDQKIHLKAGSNTFIEIDVKNPEIKVGIIPEIKISQGTYISKAIVKVKNNNKCIVSILNIRLIDQYLNKIYVKLDELPLNVFTLNLNRNIDFNKQNRYKLLTENLRLDHLNSEE
ncbi:hypothetical protein PV327_008162 [Microctonus hyperodae]|uniref:Retropepsins domain-containing protein n=1 Tax=Microctonus hyperodae TaxID=165561 RepID=A0AA39F2H9_MICHY|nr:hypothetical protein PV327_008162 [Microctonus hyperodae]